jgi:hypothetical protein
MNKTAVQELIEKIDSTIESTSDFRCKFALELLKDDAVLALEKEAEQIVDAATWGNLFESGKHYFEETYVK